ncbi:M18 family aminopeptidase [Aquisalimonas asiatica]|uniref:M18 family aminopeptidase n=1 Tax=Aquisalimonas asiatica TaxID=406100 RepID=A0A1H8U007_9GAMM|nr:M18 family aminopeptidase [Aquisalimonas asiatica]SEO96184.1 aspartyl aminopeptidase [Aquisalimonas asiatica]
MDNDNARARASARDLLEFIDRSPSPWHAVAEMRVRLEQAGFQRLHEETKWSLTAGGAYYVIRDDSTIAAFRLGAGSLADEGYRIIGAHTDSPGFRVKPAGGQPRGGHASVDVEIYGGPILATFADRDLALAGRVMLRDPNTGDVVRRLYHSDKAVLRLPNAAIHLNRQVNQEGLRFQQHDELSLVAGMLHDGLPPEDAFRAHLASRLSCEPDDVLAWELAVADTQPGGFCGLDDEFIATSQLDNLASCHAGLDALLASDGDAFSGVSMLVCFDHEEVGSQSFKGAQGSFLPDLVSRINAASGVDPDDRHRAAAASMLLSADMAHGYHPNFGRLYDQANQAKLNGGPVIKINAQQRYATDSAAEAVFMALCEEAGVPCQKYVHRNDIPCGSTIGPMTASALGVRTVDVGNAMWSMHSLRETAGASDQVAMIDVMTHFFGRERLPWRTDRAT